MQLSIGKKLFLGFGGVIVAIVLSAIFTEIQMIQMRSSQQDVLTVRYPILLAGNELSNGMDQSLAAVRGYMILGGDDEAGKKFKDERSNAWAKIDSAVSYLDSIKLSMDSQSLSIIDQIKSILPTIRDNQQSIERIAHAPENQPALALLLKTAGPTGDKMLEHLTEIIDLEDEIEADDEREPLLKMLADSRGSFAISMGSLRAYLITGDLAFKDRFDSNWLINTDAYLAIDEEIDSLQEDQLALWQQYEALREILAPVTIQMFELRLSEKWNVANYMLETDIEPDIKKISVLLSDMSKRQSKAVSGEVKKLADILLRVQVVSLAATLFAIFAGAIIGLKISRNISGTMEILVKDAHDIAEGDLTTDHSDGKLRESNDEVGQLANKFSQMSHSLSDMIATVKSHGAQMRVAAFQVASLSEEILSAAEQEQNNSSEVSNATDKLLQASKSSLRLATEASTVVKSAQEQAEIGINAVNDTIDEMELSVNEVKQTVVGIEGLDEASQQIYNITDTIKQIADQTNLLALNAAIEAARAGEHGRGFAVVSDEVRNLAIKTSQATVEIGQLIELLKSRVDESIDSMSRAANHVYASQKKAAVSASAINSIGQSVALISDSSRDICSGADDQMVQLSLLQGKLTQLFETLKEDSSRAGAVSIIARVLYGVTENINTSLDKFTTLPSGGSHTKMLGDRRKEHRIEGCLRAEIYQEHGAYEGATRSFGGNTLSIEVSTPLQENAPLVLTLFLPHKSFDDYKQQIPITLNGTITRSDYIDSVYQYCVLIDPCEDENQALLNRAFGFFDSNSEQLE